MIQIVRDPIDHQAVLTAVSSPRAGALVTFDGRVRDHSRDQEVLHLHYEAYEPMALQEMQKLAVSAKKKWPIEEVAIVHRIGTLEIGQTSVFIAVSSAHRQDAFKACVWLIDTLKETVPIWKKEFFKGGEVWVDSP